MNGYKLIYHDKESSAGGVSPFDKIVTEIVENRDVSIRALAQDPKTAWLSQAERA